MTHEPLRVEPVEVDYYQENRALAARVVRVVATVGIAYGAFWMLHAGVTLAGAMMGFGWYPRAIGSWYGVSRLLGVVAEGSLSVLLVMSAIGCFSLKPRAWKGMQGYCVAVIGINLLWTGYYLFLSLRNVGRRGIDAAGDALLSLIGMLSGPVQWSVFAVLALLVLRMREVRRLFAT